MSSTLTTTPTTTQESGFRELLRLAWPLILNNGVWTAQIVTDRALLAHHNSRELAATLNAIVIFWAIQNLFFHTTGYVATFVAQYTGASRSERIGPVVGQAIYTAMIGGAVFMIAAPFAPLLFQSLGNNSGIEDMEAIYFRCLCFGALPALITAAINGFFIGRGDSRTVLVISCIVMAVNALLASLWVFGLAGFPAMGIAGAGWATATAQAVGAIIGLCWFLRPEYRKQFRTGNFWRFEPALFRRLLRFGVPNGVFTALETGAFAIPTLVIKWIGTMEVAATNIAITLNLIAFLPAMAVGQAVEVLVGRYQGENRPEESERRTYIGLGMAWTIMFVMAAAYCLIPGVLLIPFQSKSTAEEVELAKILLRFVACFCVFDAANSIFSYALRGAGDTRFVMVVVSALPWVAMVLPTLVAYKLGWGLYGVWTAISAYIAILAFVFYSRFRHGAWKSMRVIEPVAAET